MPENVNIKIRMVTRENKHRGGVNLDTSREEQGKSAMVKIYRYHSLDSWHQATL